MQEIYFDNAATTKPSKRVVDIMMKVLMEDYGNPSSLHRKGIKAEKYIRKTSETLAKILKVDKNTIYYTSGGSESINMAIFGIANSYKRTGKHIITTVVEHPATSSPINYLKEQGYQVTYLDVDENGIINLEQLRNSIRKDTILVSIMFVNNEIGSVQPIKQIGEMIKSVNSDTIFHVDAVQAFGKYEIYPIKYNIDLLSISSHKFHGPKGVGALYVKKGVKMNPLIYGGGQQKKLRSGTENVPGIAGLGEAAKEIYENLIKNNDLLLELKICLWEKLSKSIKDVHINGPAIIEGAPHILNVRFDNVRAEVLLHALEDDDIYISTRSACASNKPEEKSPTLSAIKLNREQIDSSIRFSFSKYNTIEQINQCVLVLQKLIPRLRMFTLGGRKK